VGIGVLIGPCFLFFEGDGIDHERIALPTADLFAKEGRVWVSGVLSAIERYETISRVPVEEDGVIGTLQQLEGKAAGIVSWQTADDANSLGVHSMFEVVFQC